MSDAFIQPPNTMPRIETIWAYLSVDPKDQNEGVIGMQTHYGWMPFIAADEKRLADLLPLAQGLCDTGITVRLAKFSVREDLKTLTPQKP